VPSLSVDRWLFDQEALQEYILLCCQEPKGGLVDKPGKARDFYHTCYTLSGLSVAQHFGGQNTTSVKKLLIARDGDELVGLCIQGFSCIHVYTRRVLFQAETHPLYNIGVEAVFRASKYYSNLPVHNTGKK
jgi:protein farnesyltransferase subunit beta